MIYWLLIDSYCLTYPSDWFRWYIYSSLLKNIMSNFKLSVNPNISWLGWVAINANENLKFPLAFLAEELTKNIRSLSMNYWIIIDEPEKQNWAAAMVSSLEARILPSDANVIPQGCWMAFQPLEVLINHESHCSLLSNFSPWRGFPSVRQVGWHSLEHRRKEENVQQWSH